MVSAKVKLAFVVLWGRGNYLRSFLKDGNYYLEALQLIDLTSNCKPTAELKQIAKDEIVT